MESQGVNTSRNAASTELVGTTTVVNTYKDADAATWDIALSADTTDGSLQIFAIGEAATTIRWSGFLEAAQITY